MAAAQRYFFPRQNQGNTRLSPEQALQKAKYYCAYQERCHFEAKEKLYSFGLWKPEVETVLSQLIEENYLNEERFAIQFAGGKFRMKQWGRIKIKQELKQKQVSEYCIKKALGEIDEEAYQKTLQKLAMEKWRTLKGEKNIFIKKRKLQDYLLQKGFERDLIIEATRFVNKEIN
jgi:regulatory protein